jgi:hypothetical protein
MKWVTREHPKTDRIACPWLIRNFIDPQAEFLYVPADQVLDVAAREHALSYDAPGADYTHRNGLCSFEVLLEKYELDDPPLALLARIVHGADVADDRDATPKSRGLLAIAEGFRPAELGDHRQLELSLPVYDGELSLPVYDGELSLPVYDALYAWCRHETEPAPRLRLRLPVLAAALAAAAAGLLLASRVGRGAPTPGLPLRTIADVPLPGGSSRFDYQSLDPARHRLFVSHLAAGTVVFDVSRRRVAATIGGVAGVHGVLVAPALRRLYAAATGARELVTLDEQTLRVLRRAPAGSYPDGSPTTRPGRRSSSRTRRAGP